MQRSDLARWAILPMRLLVGYGFMQHGLTKLSKGPDVFAGILQQLRDRVVHRHRDGRRHTHVSRSVEGLREDGV